MIVVWESSLRFRQILYPFRTLNIVFQYHRCEKFSESSYSNSFDTTHDYKPPIRYDKYENNVASWCAPRKIRAKDSTTSSEEDTDKELRTIKSSKNLKSIRAERKSQRAKRIDELARPKVISSRVLRSNENHYKVSSKLQSKAAIKTSSQNNLLTIEPRVIFEKPVLRHRRPADRFAKLAEPKKRASEAMNQMGKAEDRAALAAYSKRIAELAVPKYGPTKIPPTDRPNPFAVNPQALKASCSPNIEKLARPKKLAPSVSNSKINRR
ncbi:uncharacterized protein [Venturia canescens]|uniref:uncharacterized protein isoform X2 n=1 Tax=Venturia canescens TaxID=32260 RepID=UPI001C9C7FD6|nr:uncharacterized protein LOC122407138 isoform X2 [Venturia canescens]